MLSVRLAEAAQVLRQIATDWMRTAGNGKINAGDFIQIAEEDLEPK